MVKTLKLKNSYEIMNPPTGKWAIQSKTTLNKVVIFFFLFFFFAFALKMCFLMGVGVVFGSTSSGNLMNNC